MKRARKVTKKKAKKTAAPKKKVRHFPSGFKIGRGGGGVRTAKKK